MSISIELSSIHVKKIQTDTFLPKKFFKFFRFSLCFFKKFFWFSTTQFSNFMNSSENRRCEVLTQWTSEKLFSAWRDLCLKFAIVAEITTSRWSYVQNDFRKLELLNNGTNSCERKHQIVETTQKPRTHHKSWTCAKSYIRQVPTEM